MPTVVSSFAEIEAEFIRRAHSIVWCTCTTVDTRGRPALGRCGGPGEWAVVPDALAHRDQRLHRYATNHHLAR